MNGNKSYFIIAGLILDDNNRGTAALGYGSFSFLRQKGYIQSSDKLLSIRLVNNIFKKSNREITVRKIQVQGFEYENVIINVSMFEFYLLYYWNIVFPFSTINKYLNRIKFVAAINGGDGYSDIYSGKTFLDRLPIIKLCLAAKVPLIFLPQTLGPFVNESIKIIADNILRKASKIYVRDNKYIKELQSMGLKYECCKDLSYYMQPEFSDINIIPDSVGINISGLCYFNKFRTLSGEFEQYPKLIDQLIQQFQNIGKTIYLIPHSYNYNKPEENNDDMLACRLVYNKHKDKTNVVLIDKDLRSPQIKYIISKMAFFVGTRMHANFAAIYTGVPVFGIAYSYKFEGAFNANGLDGKKQTVMINNIEESDINNLVDKIINYYVSVSSSNSKEYNTNK